MKGVGQGSECLLAVFGGGGYFFTFLLVKLMGFVVSRYGLCSDVKLSVIGQSQRM